jgi:hypothetical protein
VRLQLRLESLASLVRDPAPGTAMGKGGRMAAIAQMLTLQVPPAVLRP